MSKFEAFWEHMAHINDLCCVINLLTWDARTQMSNEGAETRGYQIGMIARIALPSAALGLFVGLRAWAIKLGKEQHRENHE